MHPTRLVAPLALALVFAAQGAAHADLPEGVYYSDYDAWFEARSHQRGRDDEGWSLIAAGRLYGDNIPANSTLEYVIKQGRTEVMRVRCEAQLRQRHLGYAYEPGVPGMLESRCRERSIKSQAIGPMTVEVHFIDGNDDSDSVIYTHQIEVRRTTRPNNAPLYYIPINQEIAASIIHEAPNGARRLRDAPDRRPGYVGLFVYFGSSDDNGPEDQQRDQQAFEEPDRLVCSIDGTRLPLAEEPVLREVRDRRVNVRHVFGDGRQNERVDYNYTRAHIMLPIAVGENPNDQLPPGWVHLEQNNGTWQCELRRTGRVMRQFSFTVADGHIVAHPEETAEGGIHLPPRSHYVEMVVPRDTRFETRVAPTESAFFGHTFVSEEARAAAAALPTIGDAQIPSEPRQRNRRRRRRRRR